MKIVQFHFITICYLGRLLYLLKVQPRTYNQNLIMQPEKKNQKEEKKQMFKQMMHSSIKASYFNLMKQNNATSKSKVQIDEEIIKEQEQQIDENTFRLMTGFKRPDESYKVYQKQGRFYIEEEGFFSCFVSRKRYNVQLSNFKFKVARQEGGIDQFLNFDTQSVDITNKGTYFIAKVKSCSKKFYFEPVEEHSKEQLVTDWVDLLKKCIDTSEGKKKGFAYLPEKIDDFYTNEHLSYQDFQKSCNSLDILLFKSPHSAATLQRTFTNSDYDHVGVVLKNKKNEIFIFESNSNEGVGLTPWKHMVKFRWYESTDKIAWRKLNINIRETDYQKIEGYVVKTLGKGFEISIGKLFTFKSTLNRNQEEEDKKTYFCSELVARLYKELGLLDEEKASTRYFPVDFSDKTKMVFKRDNVSLDHERVIAFNH